jgi:hypothetical protein
MNLTKSDSLIVADKDEKLHIAVMYEGFMEFHLFFRLPITVNCMGSAENTHRCPNDR